MSIASTAVSFGVAGVETSAGVLGGGEAGATAAAGGGVARAAAAFIRSDDGGPIKLWIESSGGVSFADAGAFSVTAGSDFNFGGSVFSRFCSGPSAGDCGLTSV